MTLKKGQVIKKGKLMLKDKLIYSYAMPYVFVFIFLVLFFVVFIQVALLDQIEQKYRLEIENSTMQDVNDMERVFNSLSVIRSDIISNSKMYAESNLEDIVQSLTVIQELKRYIVCNADIEEIIFWFQDDDYAYAGAGCTYKKSNLFLWHPYLRMTPDQSEALFKQTNEITDFCFLQDYKKEGVFDAACYTTVNINGKDAVLLVLFNVPGLREAKNFCLLDEKGAIRFSIGLEENLRGEKNEFVVDHKKYMVSGVKVQNRIYKRVIKNSEAMEGFNFFKKICYAIIALVISLSIIYLLLVIKKNVTNYKKLSHELSGNKNYKFLQKLLKGNFSKEAFESGVTSENFIYLQNKTFFIILFQLEKKLDTKSEEMELFVNSYLHGYLVELTEKNRYVYIGSLEDTKKTEYSDRCYQMWSNLESELNVHISFSISELFTDIEQIQNIFLKTVFALDFRFIKGNSCFIDARHLLNEQLTDIIYPQKLMTQLDLGVKNGDIKEINRLIEEIKSYIKESRLPLFYAKGICYEIVLDFTMIMQMTGLIKEGQRSSYAYILSQNNTIDEMMGHINNIANNIAVSILEDKANRQSKEIIDFDLYIKENALAENFSVQCMAEHFNMTASNLSTYYKQKTGVTIIDRVTDIRMEKAKECLLNPKSKMTINEIVTKVGYNNSSSFIRKFKSIYGVTPGQFIKANKATE